MDPIFFADSKYCLPAVLTRRDCLVVRKARILSRGSCVGATLLGVIEYGNFVNLGAC